MSNTISEKNPTYLKSKLMGFADVMFQERRYPIYIFNVTPLLMEGMHLSQRQLLWSFSLVSFDLQFLRMPERSSLHVINARKRKT
jgi:hypothetical protein